LCNLAEVAILAGRLAANDLGNTMSGRAYYSIALDAAREGAEDQLIAIAHGHAAQLAAAEGQITAALNDVTAACEPAQSTAAIASWLATIEATVQADCGNHSAARDALDCARTALNQPGGRSAPASFHSHGAAQLAAVTGRILVQVGDYSHACETFNAAVDDPRPAGRRHRVLILVDLATAELRSGELAAACSHATQAAELRRQAAYAVGSVRIHAFRTDAQRSLDSRESSVPWTST